MIFSMIMKDFIYPFLLVSQLQVAEAVEHNSGFFGFLPDWLDTLLSMIALVMVPVIVVVVFVAMGGKTFRLIWYVISLQPLRRWLTRKRLQDQLTYYRDMPVGGDLKIANAVMNSLSSSPIADYQGLFGALILRLIENGALVMENKATIYGSEPHPILRIGKRPNTRRPELEEQFLSMLVSAAGNDGILQPRELQQYLRNCKAKPPFFQSLKSLSREEKVIASDPDTARQVLGLRQFLLDFTQIGIRDIKEMPLWKEYLIYATLFGIANQVSQNFGDLYSDYFNTNRLALAELNIIGNNALVTYTNAMASSM